MNFPFIQSRHNSEVYECVHFWEFEKEEKCGIFVVFGWIVILTIGVVAILISGEHEWK